MAKTQPGTVKFTGAGAGSRLIGASPFNRGVLVEVHQAQSTSGRRIEGAFTLVDAGLCAYSKYLQPYIGHQFNDVSQLIDRVRSDGAERCTHILNRNSMRVAVEPDPATQVPVRTTTRPARRSRFKYQVALSFAGQDRSTAQQFARMLRDKGIVVFFDEYERADLWGKDLYQHLAKIYKEYSEYCVIFVSKSYKRKSWTQHELQQAQARAFLENREYILPIKLDNTELPGLPSTVAYLDIKAWTLEDIAEVLVQKLNRRAS